MKCQWLHHDTGDRELSEPGALMFSPPGQLPPDRDAVLKFHICVECWKHIAGALL